MEVRGWIEATGGKVFTVEAAAVCKNGRLTDLIAAANVRMTMYPDRHISERGDSGIKIAGICCVNSMSGRVRIEPLAAWGMMCDDNSLMGRTGFEAPL